MPLRLENDIIIYELNAFLKKLSLELWFLHAVTMITWYIQLLAIKNILFFSQKNPSPPFDKKWSVPLAHVYCYKFCYQYHTYRLFNGITHLDHCCLQPNSSNNKQETTGHLVHEQTTLHHIYQSHVSSLWMLLYSFYVSHSGQYNYTLNPKS